MRVILTVYAITDSAAAFSPLYLYPVFGAVQLGNNGRCEIGVLPAIAVKVAHEIAVAVKAANRVGKCAAVLQTGMGK